MDGRDTPVESPDETTVFPYHDLTPPTIDDVANARAIVRQYLPKTPLVRSESLSTELDADVYLKREDTLPTGAFKVRGGVTLVSTVDDSFTDVGLFAASSGNHGQSIAWAGREFDVPVTIVVPADANPEKVAAMERYGAEVILHGEDYDEAREHVERLAVAKPGARYVHSGNEPKLIAGVGTAGLEVVDDLPEVDRVFCPVGAGSAAAGYCLTVGELTDASVVGVQSERAPAVYRAWRDGTLEAGSTADTVAEGIATRVPFSLTLSVLRDGLDEFRLVSDESIQECIGRLFVDDRIVAEGASAAGIAAALQTGSELAGETVVVPITGRNVDAETFRRSLDEYATST